MFQAAARCVERCTRPGSRACLKAGFALKAGQTPLKAFKDSRRAGPRCCYSKSHPTSLPASAGVSSTACWPGAARFRLGEDVPKRVSPGNPRPSKWRHTRKGPRQLSAVEGLATLKARMFWLTTRYCHTLEKSEPSCE